MSLCEARARHRSDASSQVNEVPQPLARERNIPLLTDCDVCGSTDLAEIRCKVICRNCRTILQSCADL